MQKLADGASLCNTVHNHDKDFVQCIIDSLCSGFIPFIFISKIGKFNCRETDFGEFCKCIIAFIHISPIGIGVCYGVSFEQSADGFNDCGSFFTEQPGKQLFIEKEHFKCEADNKSQHIAFAVSNIKSITGKFFCIGVCGKFTDIQGAEDFTEIIQFITVFVISDKLNVERCAIDFECCEKFKNCFSGDVGNINGQCIAEKSRDADFFAVTEKRTNHIKQCIDRCKQVVDSRFDTVSIQEVNEIRQKLHNTFNGAFSSGKRINEIEQAVQDCFNSIHTCCKRGSGSEINTESLKDRHDCSVITCTTCKGDNIIINVVIISILIGTDEECIIVTKEQPFKECIGRSENFLKSCNKGCSLVGSFVNAPILGANKLGFTGFGIGLFFAHTEPVGDFSIEDNINKVKQRSIETCKEVYNQFNDHVEVCIGINIVFKHAVNDGCNVAVEVSGDHSNQFIQLCIKSISSFRSPVSGVCEICDAFSRISDIEHITAFGKHVTPVGFGIGYINTFKNTCKDGIQTGNGCTVHHFAKECEEDFAVGLGGILCGLAKSFQQTGYQNGNGIGCGNGGHLVSITFVGGYINNAGAEACDTIFHKVAFIEVCACNLINNLKNVGNSEVVEINIDFYIIGIIGTDIDTMENILQNGVHVEFTEGNEIGNDDGQKLVDVDIKQRSDGINQYQNGHEKVVKQDGQAVAFNVIEEVGNEFKQLRCKVFRIGQSIEPVKKSNDGVGEAAHRVSIELCLRRHTYNTDCFHKHTEGAFKGFVTDEFENTCECGNVCARKQELNKDLCFAEQSGKDVDEGVAVAVNKRHSVEEPGNGAVFVCNTFNAEVVDISLIGGFDDFCIFCPGFCREEITECLEPGSNIDADLVGNNVCNDCACAVAEAAKQFNQFGDVCVGEQSIDFALQECAEGFGIAEIHFNHFKNGGKKRIKVIYKVVSLFFVPVVFVIKIDHVNGLQAVDAVVAPLAFNPCHFFEVIGYGVEHFHDCGKCTSGIAGKGSSDLLNQRSNHTADSAFFGRTEQAHDHIHECGIFKSRNKVVKQPVKQVALVGSERCGIAFCTDPVRTENEILLSDGRQGQRGKVNCGFFAAEQAAEHRNKPCNDFIEVGKLKTEKSVQTAPIVNKISNNQSGVEGDNACEPTINKVNKTRRTATTNNFYFMDRQFQIDNQCINHFLHAVHGKEINKIGKDFKNIGKRSIKKRIHSLEQCAENCLCYIITGTVRTESRDVAVLDTKHLKQRNNQILIGIECGNIQLQTGLKIYICSINNVYRSYAGRISDSGI